MGIGRRTYDLGSPHHKLGAVKDPMCVAIGEATVIRVGSTLPGRVLLLETLDNLLNLVIKFELCSACSQY